MNTILNEENNYQADESVRTNIVQSSKSGKISGILSLILAVLAIISIFVPFFGAFLFWKFLLLSAALAVFGFLEANSGKPWINNITWLVSLTLLILLFILSLNSFSQRNSQEILQLWYFYGAFSFIVPILLTFNALMARKLTNGLPLSPLIIPAIFIFSASLANSRTVYAPLILLAISWGLFGLLNYLGSKN